MSECDSIKTKRKIIFLIIHFYFHECACHAAQSATFRLIGETAINNRYHNKNKKTRIFKMSKYMCTLFAPKCFFNALHIERLVKFRL